MQTKKAIPAVVMITLVLLGSVPKKLVLQSMTMPFEWDDSSHSVMVHADSSLQDTLFQVVSQEGFPIYYYKNIRTGICFDNQCRPLDMMLYWNPTGRYLGFGLPEGEFLSKYDHAPFTEAEYDRLNTLLADSLLPLGTVSFEELIGISDQTNALADGVSGATSAQVSEYVVEGAAYTTHTLWNIVYGSTQDEIVELTDQVLSSEFLYRILKKGSLSDQFWALSRVEDVEIPDPKLLETLLQMIGGDDYSLAQMALEALPESSIEMDLAQVALFSVYEEANYSMKRLIIDKLQDVTHLSADVVKMSRDMLPDLNGVLLRDMLGLYREHKIDDEDTIKKISALLTSDNRYISGKAYDFLLDFEDRDQSVAKALEIYRMNNDQ
jgi:hypothetical protein